VEVRTCSVCSIQKPLTEYYKHSQCASGHRRQCIDCIKEGRKHRERKTINIGRFSEAFKKEILNKHTRDGMPTAAIADAFKARYDPPSRAEIDEVIRLNSKAGFLTFLGPS